MPQKFFSGLPFPPQKPRSLEQVLSEFSAAVEKRSRRKVPYAQRVAEADQRHKDEAKHVADRIMGESSDE